MLGGFTVAMSATTIFIAFALRPFPITFSFQGIYSAEGDIAFFITQNVKAKLLCSSVIIISNKHDLLTFTLSESRLTFALAAGGFRRLDNFRLRTHPSAARFVSLRSLFAGLKRSRDIRQGMM